MAVPSPVSAPQKVKRGKKYFTVVEANRALPYVSRIVIDITDTYAQIVDLRRNLESQEGKGVSPQLEREYDASMDRLSDLIDELHAVGVELKDFEKGLIDFPATYEDREVLLCWKRGEKKVTHWHEVDAGFAGRQPVNMLSEAA